MSYHDLQPPKIHISSDSVFIRTMNREQERMDKDLLDAIEEERVKMDRARMEIEKLSISTEESNVAREHI